MVIIKHTIKYIMEHAREPIVFFIKIFVVVLIEKVSESFLEFAFKKAKKFLESLKKKSMIYKYKIAFNI